jgi:hypothetical protein
VQDKDNDFKNSKNTRRLKTEKQTKLTFMADIPINLASLKSRKLHRKPDIACNKSDSAVS